MIAPFRTGPGLDLAGDMALSQRLATIYLEGNEDGEDVSKWNQLVIKEQDTHCPRSTHHSDKGDGGFQPSPTEEFQGKGYCKWLISFGSL